MKAMKTPSGKFGAASSMAGSPHTPARMGRTPPAITGVSGAGSRIKVSAECGREIDRSAARSSDTKHGRGHMKDTYAD